MTTTLSKTAVRLAIAGFDIGAIKINAEQPFLWASGTHNPIYNDNRMFLYYPEYRKLIVDGFVELIADRTFSKIEVIAGVMSAGVAHGDRLAERLDLPYTYVRDKPKDHGKRNRIEGLPDDGDYNGASVLVIEDLFSTGGSSVKAVQAVRDANGIVHGCFSIFSYNLPRCVEMFAGSAPFDGDKCLDKPCEIASILTYPDVLKIGIENGYIKPDQAQLLESWMEDQPNWGAKNGFPPVAKN